MFCNQVLSGGIKQFFGSGLETNKCRDCPPRTNDEYGNGEQPLMFAGDEPITDCLYSLNFAAIGLREAYGATGNTKYAEAESTLLEYLTRIQVTSKDHPELEGFAHFFCLIPTVTFVNF